MHKFGPFFGLNLQNYMISGLQGDSTPLPKKKVVYCELNMHKPNFRHFFGLNLQKYMISGSRKGQTFFCLKICIFGKHKCTIFSPFSVKVYTILGLARGSVPLPIGKFCICKLFTHNFRPLFGLNLQKYIISGGPL